MEADIVIQQYYRDRSCFPFVDGFKVEVNGKLEVDADSLQQAMKVRTELWLKLNAQPEQQTLDLNGELNAGKESV